MDFGKGVGYLAAVFEGEGFAHDALFIDDGGEAFAAEVFHDVVGCAVFFEDVVDAYYVAVVEGGYHACLFDEFLFEAFDEFLAAY